MVFGLVYELKSWSPITVFHSLQILQNDKFENKQTNKQKTTPKTNIKQQQQQNKNEQAHAVTMSRTKEAYEYIYSSKVLLQCGKRSS